MVLSDRDIHHLAEDHPLITPLDPSRVQPSSVDLTLASDFLVADEADLRPFRYGVTLGDKSSYPEMVKVSGPRTIRPQEFMLASTAEGVDIPSDIVARVEGKSSVGRLGILIHATAGYIDPGFRGNITLELYNLSHVPIELVPGASICQISFIKMTSHALRPYGSEGLGSRYQNSEGTIASRYGQ